MCHPTPGCRSCLIVLKRTGIVLLPGTQVKAERALPYWVQSLHHHWAVQAGFLSGLSNKSAGCAVLLRKRVFAQKHIAVIDCMKGELAGRSLTVRIKSGRFDFHVGVAYYPPRS